MNNETWLDWPIWDSIGSFSERSAAAGLERMPDTALTTPMGFDDLLYRAGSGNWFAWMNRDGCHTDDNEDAGVRGRWLADDLWQAQFGFDFADGCTT